MVGEGEREGGREKEREGGRKRGREGGRKRGRERESKILGWNAGEVGGGQ